MAGKTIYDPAYIEDLKGTIDTTRNGLDDAFRVLEDKYAGHGGLWEDAEANGPAETFGLLLGEMRSTMTSYLENLETTAGNVTNYRDSMTQVATTYNFNQFG